MLGKDVILYSLLLISLLSVSVTSFSLFNDSVTEYEPFNHTQLMQTDEGFYNLTFTSDVYKPECTIQYVIYDYDTRLIYVMIGLFVVVIGMIIEKLVYLRKRKQC